MGRACASACLRGACERRGCIVSGGWVRVNEEEELCALEPRPVLPCLAQPPGSGCRSDQLSRLAACSRARIKLLGGNVRYRVAWVPRRARSEPKGRQLTSIRNVAITLCVSLHLIRPLWRRSLIVAFA